MLAADSDPRTVRADLANHHRRDYIWAEADQDELEARRVRTRWPRLEEGAVRVARLGARKCIECGQRLASDAPGHKKAKTREKALGGRGRRLHCSACLERFSPAVRNTHEESMRAVLDAATGQRRARRAARRA